MKIATLALAFAYVGFVFVVAPYMAPRWSPWVLSAASLVFVFLYIFTAHGNVLWAISLVALFSLLFPVAVLVAISWSHYPSFGAQLSSFIATVREHEQLWGFELLLPLISAGLGAVVAKHMRSNIAVKRDAPQAARPLP